MTQPLPSPGTAAQQKSYVTYTAPSISSIPAQITLHEAPSLLASSGTTGFRTWEAALFLGSYFGSTAGKHFVVNRNIIELGAGTGFLSIFCAKHLNAHYVLATDGSQEIVADMKTNIGLNDLKEGYQINAEILQWGHTLINSIAGCRDANMVYDLAVGADITYDLNSIPALTATMGDLFELYPNLQIMISATVRNKETLEAFTIACLSNNFTCKTISVYMPKADEQTGFFIPSSTPIKIILVTRLERVADSFKV